MKKDIEFPESKNVFVAAVREENKNGEYVWYVHIINNNDFAIENVMVTSRGYIIEGNYQKFISSTLRHNLGNFNAKSSGKIELITPNVFEIYNEYWVTYFAQEQLLDRKFTFGPHTIDAEFEEELPVIPFKGIIVI